MAVLTGMGATVLFLFIVSYHMYKDPDRYADRDDDEDDDYFLDDDYEEDEKPAKKSLFNKKTVAEDFDDDFEDDFFDEDEL